MLIDNIALRNFRVYHDLNELELATGIDENISVIAGNNGYGKTSFLTALVWGLYGKLMVDVDERYRQDIQESGGYKRYCEKLMNRMALSESDERIRSLKDELNDFISVAKEAELKERIAAHTSFSVSLLFRELMIPSVTCETLEIKRTYHVRTHVEQVEILIDGKVNELTKGIGPEIFINDFVLPKEIAKFFFFDAEKIVSLADINTIEEKRYLSQAYAEVLGIKKYTDLKDNLVNVRLRLRKASAVRGEKDALEKLQKSLISNKKLVEHFIQQIEERREIICSKRVASDKYQEKLIREGSSLTLEDLQKLKEQQAMINHDLTKLKATFNELLDLAPFAMLAKQMGQVKAQLEAEINNSTASRALIEGKFKALQQALHHQKLSFLLEAEKEAELLALIKTTLLPEDQAEVKTLLDFTPDQQNRFFAIYDHLKDAFSKKFRQLINDQKRLQSIAATLQRKLQDAESKEKDPVIAAIRDSKRLVDDEIKHLEHEVSGLTAKKQATETEIQTQARKVSELSKKIALEDNDLEKDKVAERLIEKLERFIFQLKQKKKVSLEEGIQQELNRLMHKEDFVSRVNVIIAGDLIDIELYDHQNLFIDKELLSKGEQQLYATALLKALVNESNIKFPVFIDSPLQKFDKRHSANIIREFYPNLSGQVVLFPLLQKELNEEEYGWLQPRVGKAYIIRQQNKYQSGFAQIEPEQLFSAFLQSQTHVQ